MVLLAALLGKLATEADVAGEPPPPRVVVEALAPDFRSPATVTVRALGVLRLGAEGTERPVDGSRTVFGT